MAKGKSGFSAGTLFGIVLVAIIAIFLFTQLTAQTAEGLTFVAPDEAGINDITMWILRIAITAGALWIGMQIIKRLTGKTVGRKDIFVVILLGVATFFLWEFVVSGILSASTITDISFGAKQALGLP